MAVELMWSDDGIVLRLPESVDELPDDELLIDPDEIEDADRGRSCPGTAMFAVAVPRVRGAGRCCCPKRRPDQRTPLWQQRQRSADLLSVAGALPELPDPPRGHPRVPQRRVRRARPRRGAARPAVAARSGSSSVDSQQASPFAQSLHVRVDRGVHVRGRRAAGRAPGRGAGPRPRPAARPARCRGAARAHRRRRAGRPRARAAAPGRRPPGPRRRRGARPAPAARAALARRARAAVRATAPR